MVGWGEEAGSFLEAKQEMGIGSCILGAIKKTKGRVPSYPFIAEAAGPYPVLSMVSLGRR